MYQEHGIMASTMMAKPMKTLELRYLMIQFLKAFVITVLVPATTKTFQARMTVNEAYKPGYSNSSSDEFNTFATNFSHIVGEFLNKTLFGFVRVEVTNLANGSVVVDFDIVVQNSSNATVNVIVRALNDGNGTGGLGYTILGNVSVNATDQQSTSSIPSQTPTAAGINSVQVGFAAIITFYFFLMAFNQRLLTR